MFADQRADPRRLLLDDIERICARHFGVEPGPRITVEQRQRTLRAGIPVAVGRSRQATDAAQLGLHRFGDVGLRRSGAEGREVHGLVLVGGWRGGCLVRGDLVGSGLFRSDLVGGGLFSRGALLLGGGGLILRHLLSFFGGEARLLGGLGVSIGFRLLRLLGAFGREPRALLFGQPRLLGRGDPGLFGRDLLELKLGEAGIETIRVLRQERVERALVADLQRQFIVAAGLGLRAGRAARLPRRVPAPAARLHRRATHRRTAPAGCRWS